MGFKDDPPPYIFCDISGTGGVKKFKLCKASNDINAMFEQSLMVIPNSIADVTVTSKVRLFSEISRVITLLSIKRDDVWDSKHSLTS